MRREEVFQWRTLWIGKWRTTRYKCSKEFNRIDHPEAVKIEGTMEVRWLPKTD